MGEKIKKYFKKEKTDIFAAFIVLFTVSTSYIGYLYYIGIPMTKAKNYYNSGYLYYQENNYDKAKEALFTSLDAYYTPEAYDLLQEIN